MVVSESTEKRSQKTLALSGCDCQNLSNKSLLYFTPLEWVFAFWPGRCFGFSGRLLYVVHALSCSFRTVVATVYDIIYQPVKDLC